MGRAGSLAWPFSSYTSSVPPTRGFVCICVAIPAPVSMLQTHPHSFITKTVPWPFHGPHREDEPGGAGLGPLEQEIIDS